MTQVINELGADRYFGVGGRDCNLFFYTKDGDGNPSQPYRTLFMQEMIRNGILAPSFIVSYSHTEEDIDLTVEAVRQSLRVYMQAISDGLDKLLIGPSIKPVYRKFN